MRKLLLFPTSVILAVLDGLFQRDCGLVPKDFSLLNCPCSEDKMNDA